MFRAVVACVGFFVATVAVALVGVFGGRSAADPMVPVWLVVGLALAVWVALPLWDLVKRNLPGRGSPPGE